VLLELEEFLPGAASTGWPMTLAGGAAVGAETCLASGAAAAGAAGADTGAG